MHSIKFRGVCVKIVNRFAKFLLYINVPKTPWLVSIKDSILFWIQNNCVCIDGAILYINPDDKVIGKHLLRHGKWEEFETEIFLKYIKEGDIILDIGANIG